MDIEIPTADGQVVISRNDLPPGEDILAILQDENSDKSLYHQFALAYYQHGDMETFRQLLQSDGILRIAAMLLQLDVSSVPEVTELLNKVKPSAETEFLKGLLLIYTGQHVKAQQQVKMALDQVRSQSNDRLLVLTMAAKAMIQFWIGERASALKTLQLLWSSHRGLASQIMKGDVRLALAQAYYADGQKDKAAQVVKVAAQDKSTINGHYLASVMEFNQAKETMDTKLIQSAAGHAKKAQNLDKELSNRRVVLLLSDIMFNKGQYDKSLLLAQKALGKQQNVKHISSCANYYIARVHHVKKEFSDAYKFYMKSVELYPELSVGVYYGLAQICYERKQYKECVKYLDKVIKDAADIESNYDVYKLMAAAKSNITSQVKDSIALHKKLVVVKAEFSVLLTLAQQLESTDIKESLKYYTQAYGLIKDNANIKSKEKMLFLLNNIAALHHYDGNLNEAVSYSQQALEVFGTLKDEDNLPDVVHQSFITILYNMARVLEDQNEYEQAKGIYERIIEKQPNYLDALLRLGSICQVNHEFPQAAKFYKDAYAIANDASRKDPESVTVCLLLLALLDQIASKSAGLTKNAKINIDKILKKLRPNDTYSLLLLGNDRLVVARYGEGSKTKDDVKSNMKQDAYKDAHRFFEKILRQDNQCLWAAQGIAIVQAETNLVQESVSSFGVILDAFRQKSHGNSVRDTLTAEDFVYLNAAHAYVTAERYDEAARLYEQLAKDHIGEALASILLFQARAHYIHGRSDGGQPQDMLECIMLLQKCLEMEGADSNLALKFNLALALQQYASLVCDQSSKDRTLDVMEQADGFITKAKIMFGDLKVAITESNGKNIYGFDQKLAEQRQRHCEHIQNTVNRHITQYRANAQMQKEAMEELQQKRQRDEELLQKQLEDSKRKKLEDEAQLEKQRMEMYKQLEEERSRDVEEPPARKQSQKLAKQPKRKRSKKQKSVEALSEPELDQAVQPESDADAEQLRQKKIKSFGKRSELSKATVDSDSEEEEQPVKRVKAAVVSDEEE